MCQSKSNGGKRCDDHPTSHSRSLLKSRLRYAHAHGKDTTKIEEKIDSLSKAQEKYGKIVTTMDLPLPDSTTPVFDLLRRSGFVPLVVGGSVRDALLGKEPKDIDIEVYGAGIDEVSKKLRKKYRVDEVGKAFGVLKITLSDGLDLDISVPREDNRVGAGHRGFEVTTNSSMSVAEAAKRRDYTLNSMGYDPLYGVCVDPYDGRKDLENNVLRHVSDAFGEDPLRVLRGFQFAGRFDASMDEKTVEVCKSMVDTAKDLPVERIRGEWEKFYLKSPHPSKALSVLKATGWDTTITSLTENNTAETSAQLERACQYSLSPEHTTQLKGALISRNMNDKDALNFTKTTIEGSKLQHKTHGLSRAQLPQGKSDTDIRTWALEMNPLHTSIEEYARYHACQGKGDISSIVDRARELNCHDGPQKDFLQGRDVLEVFPDKSPGPWMGQLLRKARDEQRQGVFTTPEKALQWLKTQEKV